VMPRMGGRDLARRFVELRPQAKVIHMSGYPGIKSELGEDPPGFLQKPFSAESLLSWVRRVLDTPG